MKVVVLTSLATAAFQFVYYSQTKGIKVSDVVIIGQDSQSYDLFREYSRINSFGLHFVDDPNGEACLELMKKLGPDVIKIITERIIRKPLLEIPRIGVVNTHAAWLPDFRGNDTPWWAILEGGKLGVAVHFVSEGVDTGDIIVRRELKLKPGDTTSSVLTRNHYENKWQTTTEALLKLRDGTAELIKQSPEDGKQYFVMHPKLIRLVDRILEKLT